jgi:hypothetical protein
VVEATEFGTFKEFRVDLFEEDGESEGREEGTKGSMWSEIYDTVSCIERKGTVLVANM